MLRSRELSPNDVILETRLSRQLKISRTPLREAIRRLEGERILERQRSGTLVVRAISIEDLLHIWQIRILLEGMRPDARLARSRFEILKLCGQINCHEKTMEIRHQKTSAQWAAIAFSHCAGLWKSMLAAIIETSENARTCFAIRRVPERAIRVCEEHLAIVDALLAGEGDEARAAMQRHIEGVRAYTLEKLGAL